MYTAQAYVDEPLWPAVPWCILPGTVHRLLKHSAIYRRSLAAVGTVLVLMAAGASGVASSYFSRWWTRPDGQDSRVAMPEPALTDALIGRGFPELSQPQSDADASDVIYVMSIRMICTDGVCSEMKVCERVRRPRSTSATDGVAMLKLSDAFVNQLEDLISP